MVHSYRSQPFSMIIIYEEIVREICFYCAYNPSSNREQAQMHKVLMLKNQFHFFIEYFSLTKNQTNNRYVLRQYEAFFSLSRRILGVSALSGNFDWVTSYWLAWETYWVTVVFIQKSSVHGRPSQYNSGNLWYLLEGKICENWNTSEVIRMFIKICRKDPDLSFRRLFYGTY